MDDAHLLLSLVTVGDPSRLTGGYLYHLRMARAAPGLGARVRFVSFPDRPFPLAAADGPRVLGRAARGEGREVSVEERAPRGAGSAARRRRVDAVLLDSIAATFAGPWLATRDPGVPVVGVLHQPPGGIDHGPLRRLAQDPLDRLAYRRARLLIVASDHLADVLVGQGFDRGRIRVVPPGRDLGLGDGPPGPPGPPGPTREELRGGRGCALLCVGNWVPRKGILELLDAVARLPAGALTLHLAGDGDLDPRYGARVRSRLARPDLAGRTVVHGPLPARAVAGLYAAADAFALPAYREPYGTVWGEAMAAGLPVVGWRAGNLPYLAPEGEAVMVEPGDVDALSAALGRLAADEAERRRIGRAAARRAADRPTWDRAAGMFFAAVREALEA